MVDQAHETGHGQSFGEAIKQGASFGKYMVTAFDVLGVTDHGTDAVRAEEEALIADLKKMGAYKQSPLHNRLREDLAKGVDMEYLMQSTQRKADLRLSAEAIAKKCGETIPLPARGKMLDWVVPDSAASQTAIRGYLREKLDKMMHEKVKACAEHPQGHGDDGRQAPAHAMETLRQGVGAGVEKANDGKVR